MAACPLVCFMFENSERISIAFDIGGLQGSCCPVNLTLVCVSRGYMMLKLNFINIVRQGFIHYIIYKPHCDVQFLFGTFFIYGECLMKYKEKIFSNPS
jgi:hypothetical protein